MKSRGKRFGFVWFWSLVCIVFLVYPYFIMNAVNEPSVHEGRKDNTMSFDEMRARLETAPTSPPSENRHSDDGENAPRKPKATAKGANQIHLSDLPKFAWRYMESDRSGGRLDLLETDNLCFNMRNQLVGFGHESAIPKVQLRASDRSLDRFVEIQHAAITPELADAPIDYITDRTLFVIAGVWHYHLSHFFINNYMPLVNLLNNYYGAPDWLTTPRDLSFDTGEGEIFDSNYNSLHFTNVVNRQPNARTKILCYKKAVLGLNSTCSCCGCHNKFYPEKSPVYRQTREFIYDHYLNQTLPKSAFELPINVRIIQRGQSRKIMNLENVEHYITHDLGLKCTVVNTERGTSFADQIKMMSDTTILIASHGNALGNAFWLPDHAAVIEVQSFGQKGNLWFPISYSRGNHSHPLYYYNVSCYDEYTSTSKCRISPDSQPSANFNVDVDVLGRYIKYYVEYHKEMSKLDRNIWDNLELDTMQYLEGH